MWNRRLVVALLVLVCAWPTLSWAQQELRSSSKGASTPLPITGTSIDSDHNALDISQITTTAGEDVLNDVQKVESRFSNLPTGATTSKMSSDTAIKNAPGFLKRMTCWSDAVATAGNIKLLDNTVAGAGNVLLDFDVLAVAYLPFTIEFDVPFSVGLYFDVTTTADLFCQVSYR